MGSCPHNGAEDLPSGAFERLADFVLSNAQRFPDQSMSLPPEQIRVAEQYVMHKMHGYSLPVICSERVAEKFIPGGGYPRVFFVDPQGRRVQRPVRAEQTLEDLEEMANQMAN